MTIERKRAPIGTMRAATERDDESCLTFVEGVRGFISKSLDKVEAAEAGGAVAEFEARAGHRPQGPAESRQTLDRVKSLGLACNYTTDLRVCVA